MQRCRHSQASSCDQHRPISSTLACPAYAEPSIVSQERVTPTSCTCICATSHRSRGRRDSRLVPCILLDPPRCIALRLTSRHKPQRNRVVCDAGDSRASCARVHTTRSTQMHRTSPHIPTSPSATDHCAMPATHELRVPARIGGVLHLHCPHRSHCPCDVPCAHRAAPAAPSPLRSRLPRGVRRRHLARRRLAGAPRCARLPSGYGHVAP